MIAYGGGGNGVGGEGGSFFYIVAVAVGTVAVVMVVDVWLMKAYGGLVRASNTTGNAVNFQSPGRVFRKNKAGYTAQDAPSMRSFHLRK